MWILIKILLKFVPEGPINNISALVQIMAWRQPGDKPLSEPMMISLLTHICITRPQWIKNIFKILNSQKKIWKDRYSPQCLLIAQYRLSVRTSADTVTAKFLSCIWHWHLKEFKNDYQSLVVSGFSQQFFTSNFIAPVPPAVVHLINSLRPSDTIWRHRSGSTLAQVMACCPTATSHYLNQCWLIMSKVQRHSY